MEPTEILEIASLSVSTLLWVSTPIMLVALGVGLIIALFQALTSIQEMTLTFVPKIIVVFLALLFLLPFMSNKMMTLTQELFSRIANGG